MEQFGEDFPDGIWEVLLTPLTQPEQIAASMADVLGFPFNSSQPVSVKILLERLSKLHLVLLLDNCEHLNDHVAGLVRRVLQAAPGVRILATSRQTLQVPGERVVSVWPLDAGNDSPTSNAEDVHYEAVQLLFDRAASVGIALCDSDRADAKHLCQLLDGIPLAIELAATRLRTMGIKDLVGKLAVDRRFTLLDIGTHYSQPHHSTLSAMISWSYDRCSPEQQMLWKRLSVFPDTFRLDVAEQVCSDDAIPVDTVADLLMALVDQSMLVADIRDGVARYRMLTTMRSFAEQKLREHGEREEARIRQAHAEHYRDWAVELSGSVQSPQEIAWLRLIWAEMPSFRAALDTFLNSGQAHEALRLEVALGQSRWGYALGQLGEARTRLERALDAQTELHRLQVMGISLLITIGVSQGDHEMVRARLAEASEICDRLDNPPDLKSWILFSKALIMTYADADPRAVDVVAEAQRLWLETAPPGSVYPARSFVPMCAALVGPPELAFKAADDDIERVRATGSPIGLNWARWCRGIAELKHGSAYCAIDTFIEALASQMEIGDLWGPTWSLDALAWALVEIGRHEPAAVLMGTVRQWQQDTVGIMEVGIVQKMHYHWETIALARLGEAEFAAASDRGAAMSRSQVLAYAQEQAAIREGRPSTPGGLSEREYEVARLVAAAMTNRQIAEKLFVSPRTIDAHLSSIRNKLGLAGVGSRVDISVWWGQNQQ
ncbi:LuxR C-terminal-related transcriptional regulator [Lentzea sp. JNUCC 0626]|uniref:LuxR C-terminal-related transcriptional regulator n=1 Tax=Lentzea sp. JNUCC 0626 TaxID=3367513 RepID=UPI0037487481